MLSAGDQFSTWIITLNESPSEKEGKSADESHADAPHATLNESPSEKEGKLPSRSTGAVMLPLPQ